jgi:hypothetical protein
MFTPFNDIDLDGLAAQKVAVVHPTLPELPSNARGYAANNIYPGFPPLMSDGRALIASWQPEAVENNSLLLQSGVKSNWEYRKYLTQNAETIMRHNMREAENDVGYVNLGVKRVGDANALPFLASIPRNIASPALYSSYVQPEHSYGKFESDLKADYLSREQLAARIVTPVISQAELLEWQKKRSK